MSHKRLNEGIRQSFDDMAAIDQLMGKPLLNGVSCVGNVPSLKKHCASLKQCSSGSSKEPFDQTVEDTLLAMRGIHAIEKKQEELEQDKYVKNQGLGWKIEKSKKGASSEEYEQLEVMKNDLRSLYPWTRGKVFKKGYQEGMGQSQVKTLVSRQLKATKESLLDRRGKFERALSCLGGKDRRACTGFQEAMSKTPADAFFGQDIFQSSTLKKAQRKDPSNKNKREAFKKSLFASNYLSNIQCRHESRFNVSKARGEINQLVADTGLIVLTAGFGTVAMLGKFSLHLGKSVSQAQRLRNLGFIGADVAVSAPFISQAVSDCKESMNQVENEYISKRGSSEGDMCREVPVRTTLTADLRSCLMGAAFASMPLTIPGLGLLVKSLRGVRGQAQRALGRKVTAAEAKAIKEAHLVGRGQKGLDGKAARIGNYTQAQIRRKAEVLRKAGLNKEEVRTLMEKEVVGQRSQRLAGVANRVGGLNPLAKVRKGLNKKLDEAVRTGEKIPIESLTARERAILKPHQLSTTNVSGKHKYFNFSDMTDSTTARFNKKQLHAIPEEEFTKIGEEVHKGLKKPGDLARTLTRATDVQLKAFFDSVKDLDKLLDLPHSFFLDNIHRLPLPDTQAWALLHDKGFSKRALALFEKVKHNPKDKAWIAAEKLKYRVKTGMKNFPRTQLTLERQLEKGAIKRQRAKDDIHLMDVDKVSPEKLADLDIRFFREINPKGGYLAKTKYLDFYQMSDKLMDGVPTEKLRAIHPESFRILKDVDKLPNTLTRATDEQFLSAFTRKVNSDEINKLPVSFFRDNIHRIPVDDYDKIPKLADNVMSGLDNTQLHAIPADKFARLSNQVENVAAFKDTLARSTDEQFKAFIDVTDDTSKLAKVPISFFMDNMHRIPVEELHKFPQLRVASRQLLSKMSKEQKTALNKLSRRQRKRLTQRAGASTPRLRAAEINKQRRELRNKLETQVKPALIKSDLSPEELSVIDVEHLRAVKETGKEYLNSRYINFHAMDDEVMRHLSTEKLHAIPPSEFRMLYNVDDLSETLARAKDDQFLAAIRGTSAGQSNLEKLPIHFFQRNMHRIPAKDLHRFPQLAGGARSVLSKMKGPQVKKILSCMV